MRTFEQYIAESFNFRLGGKTNKGDGVVQEVPCFKELKKGDFVTVYDINSKSNKVEFHAEFEFVSFNKSKLYFSYCYVINLRNLESGALHSLYIPEEVIETECTTYISCFTPDEIVTLMSTHKIDKKEARYMVDAFSKEIASSNYVICESVDFRLGGKANKGTVIGKPLREIEAGDEIYMWWLNNDEVIDPKELQMTTLKIVSKTWDNGGTLRLKYTVNGSRESMYFVEKYSNLDLDYDVWNNYDGYEVYITREATPEEIVELIEKETTNESVDFRLGGSANKGYRSKKVFNDLKRGDTVYTYGINTIERKLEWTLNRSLFSINDKSLDIGHTISEYSISLPEDFKDRDCSIFCRNGSGQLKHMTYVYSTEEISDEEALEIALNRDKYEEDGSIIIVESVNFRLGGKMNKGEVASEKKFCELERGDYLYKNILDQRGKYIGSYQYKIEGVYHLDNGSVEVNGEHFSIFFDGEVFNTMSESVRFNDKKLPPSYVAVWTTYLTDDYDRMREAVAAEKRLIK